MVIFHSYVKLPEGKNPRNQRMTEAQAPPTTTTQSPSSTSAGTETTTAPIDDGWELHYGLNCVPVQSGFY